MAQYGQKILAEIKTLIRRSDLTYRDLALTLNISESGLKKILTRDDTSLTIAEKLCKALGVNLSDLIKSIEDKDLISVQFTNDQIHFFEKSDTHFLVYWMLVYERRPLHEILEKLHLEDKAAKAIIFKLDKLDLITLQNNGLIQLPEPQSIKWIDRSTFVKKLYKKWGTALLYDCVEKQEGPDHFFSIRYFQLTSGQIEKLRIKMFDLEKELMNETSSAMRLKKEKLHHVRWLVALDQNSWSDQLINNPEIKV